MSWTIPEATIPFIDRYFAEVWLKAVDAKNLHQACFLSFLLSAARNGHLFVEIKKGRISPLPEELWEVKATLNQRLCEGAAALPRNLLEEAFAPIVSEGERFYLRRLFQAQRQCQMEWERVCMSIPEHVLIPDKYDQEMERLKQQNQLTAEQVRAVDLGCQSQILILTGGPGTGKTFTAASLLCTLWNSLSVQSQEQFSIAIAAPTGKAALTLQSSISNTLGASILKDKLEAKTIHALLGLSSDRAIKEKLSPLPYDLVIVDEVSMIDVELMELFLSSIKSGARLILIGDPHQLPPVDGPAIFPELLKWNRMQVELTQCLRAESSALVDLASAVRTTGAIHGDSIHVKLLDKTYDYKDMIANCAERFPLHLDGKIPENMWQEFQRFRILTPLRKGRFGSDQINQLLLQTLQKKGVSVFPILIAANDHSLKLFNGEMGVLVMSHKKQNLEFGAEDQVYFANGRKIPALLLPRYEWGYATTIHKSQGSEFDEILLLLPEEARPFSKALIYTAVTRARKNLSIWGLEQ